MKTATEMIRDYRISHGIIQKHVAQKAGIPAAKLSAYEKGNVRLPADEFMNIVVNGFGMTMEDFLKEQGENIDDGRAEEVFSS